MALPGTQTEEQLLERLQARDATLWATRHLTPPRLGWLDAPRQSERDRKSLERWAAAIDEETIVLLGTGEITATARVLVEGAAAFSSSGARRLLVGDTTEPETLSALPIEEAFVVICSKSGADPQSLALFDYARSRNRDVRRFAVLSDAGTPLARQAEELRVERLFESRPDLGGCYGALDLAGMIPAALLGYDLEELLGRALDVDRHSAVALGVQLGEAARQGVEKVAITAGAAGNELASWTAELLASVSGEGRGLIGLPARSVTDRAGDDRQFLELGEHAPNELGALLFRLQLAASIAAHLLGVDPFGGATTAGEVAAAAEALLLEPPLPLRPEVEAETFDAYLREELRDGDYLSLEAYLPDIAAGALEQLRSTLGKRHPQLAVTAALAPRALYASGELHHHGPPEVLVAQLLPRGARAELPVPLRSYNFGTLTDAFGIADFDALSSLGRRVIRVPVEDPEELC